MNNYTTQKANEYARKLTQAYSAEVKFYANQFGIFEGKAHNNAYDAFRHAYTSAVVTMEKNEKQAYILGELNELHGDINHDQSAEEKNMDRWNNSIGRKIGLISNSKSDIANKVYQSLQNGELITNIQDTRKYYHTKLSNQDITNLSAEFLQKSQDLDDKSKYKQYASIEKLKESELFKAMPVDRQEKILTAAYLSEERKTLEATLTLEKPTTIFGFSQAALEQADKMMQERLAQNQNQNQSQGRSLG